MIDERHLAMIHAEFDGELADADRAELSRYLLANPEARALRDELRELGRLLDRAGSVAPPDGLAESALAAIGSRFPARSGTRFGWSAQPTALRYAAVFAGGLIVSALAYQFGQRGEPMDTTTLVGTMASHDFTARPSPVAQVRVDLEQVTGTVNLHRVRDARLLELDLRVRQPITVVAVQHGREFRIDLPVSSPEGGDDEVFWVLAPEGSAAPVELRLLSAGAVIQTATIGAAAY